MTDREQLTREIAKRVTERFGTHYRDLSQAPSGELTQYLNREISDAVAASANPFQAIIRDWEGQAYHLDLCWWESEPTPEKIVLGLAGAILDYEIRQIFELPR